ncbi:hypothetical protein NLG97_g11208 [Lecanicillium saksenae]|uniref:Uncharacterized protein n=1 Tax=Lecanicillium saksenae TaxID=468837 RepID=A0ACC1QCC7_9HYPO|nr:hypothetical protein NLG97_g11208 [Lecanicillium saksenae]
MRPLFQPDAKTLVKGGWEMYLDLLANNIGVVRDIDVDGNPGLLVDGSLDVIPDWGYYEVGDVAEELRAEEKRADPDKYRIKLLRTAKRRNDLGWHQVEH